MTEEQMKGIHPAAFDEFGKLNAATLAGVNLGPDAAGILVPGRVDLFVNGQELSRGAIIEREIQGNEEQNRRYKTKERAARCADEQPEAQQGREREAW